MTMKTLAVVAGLLASTVAASAADMALQARRIMPAPVWSWTGFYIGAHVGAGWGTTEAELPIGANAFFPLVQNDSSGFLGGVQAGANYQAGWAVFGVQG